MWQSGGDSCPVCDGMDGQVFDWGSGPVPGSIHPNCQCSAEPVLDGAEDNPPAPSQPYLTPAEIAALAAALAALRLGGPAARLGLAAIQRIGGNVAGRVMDRLRQGEGSAKPAETGTPPPPGGRPNTDWKLGSHKSDAKWQNQMRDRNWTKDEITDTIKNGKEYSAPNKVRDNIDPSATATRYEKDGKFVVRDDQTGEILQISGPGEFKPMGF